MTKTRRRWEIRWEKCWIRKHVTQTYGESCQLLPWLLPLGTWDLPGWKGQVPLLFSPMKRIQWVPIQGIRGTTQRSSKFPFQPHISTKAPEPPASSIRNINIRTRGKEKLPRGGYRATDVPRRTRNKEKEQQPSGGEAERSAKLETGRPEANVAALCQGLCLLCPCFICPGAMWGTFFSPVINLQVSWAFNPLNNLVFANVRFELAVSLH